MSGHRPATTWTQRLALTAGGLAALAVLGTSAGAYAVDTTTAGPASTTSAARLSSFPAASPLRTGGRDERQSQWPVATDSAPGQTGGAIA